jgi:hypothetical protein
MTAILLLEEKSEAVKQIDWPRMLRQPDDATPGCTCDRWGHPCLSRVQCESQPTENHRQFLSVKK